MRSKNAIPAKLRARRVREHVHRVLVELRAARVTREASSCISVTEISWRCLDLYTIALDEADDDELRFLVGQARGTIIAHLIASNNQRVIDRLRA